MEGIYFRHDKPRMFQRFLVRDIHDSIAAGTPIFANAPTGSGKTDAALSAAVTYAVANNKTVFFLTPKISQHKIAMQVVKGIAEKHSLDLRAVDIVGRKHCCLDDALLELEGESFYHACEKKRRKGECTFYRRARGYNPFEEKMANKLFRKVLREYGSGKMHHELITLAMKRGACPYEWLLMLGEHSDVVIADYYHFMVPSIRTNILGKMNKRVQDCVVVVDEAHNLPKRIREYLSSTVSYFLLKRVEKEMKILKLDPPPLADQFSMWAGEMLDENRETVVRADDFVKFMLRFGLTYEELSEYFSDVGFSYIEETGKKSAAFRFSVFLSSWQGMDESCVRIVRKKNGYHSLSKRLLDPSVATAVLTGCARVVLMSGTLVPLEMHRDVLGFHPGTALLRKYPSPFPSASLLNIITKGVTTRYSERDEKNFTRIAGMIDEIIRATPGGTALFFPSYTVLKGILPFLGSGHFFVQEEGMSPSEIRELLHDFSDGGVLCAVQGGSLAEGVDYAGGQIKTAVVVGVALEEMDTEVKALVDYYQKKFGKGWEYGYAYPAAIKAIQAAGRGRRKESDRVAVVYMDERFTWKDYNWIIDRKNPVVVTENPVEHIREFWKGFAGFK